MTSSASSSSTISSSTSSDASPYTLHHSDNPGALITPVVLREDNYSEWATEFWNSLQAKQKIGLVDGSIVKPTTNPDLAKWTAANSMIVGWLRTSIDPQLRSTVSHIPDAHKLWESLKLRFSVKNGVRKHLLLDEINNCKQDGQTVLDYYGRLIKLWDDYTNVSSSCDCTCAAAASLEKEREDARVHKFLFGLDEARFSSIRSQIIDEDPLSPLNAVYSRVIREEQHILTMRSKEVKQDAVGFTVRNESASRSSSTAAAGPPKSRDPNRFCTHCSRKGHENNECFVLHGYPDWWYEQQQQVEQLRTYPLARGRGNGGRTSTRGRGSVRGRSRANVSRLAPAETSSSSQPSADQLSALINLLQSQKSQISTERLSGKTKLSDVILDTGASHHMTGDLSLLHDIQKISSSSVTFPDGRRSRATLSGTLPLNSDYSLLDVLYVPDFNCTLISVSKLLKQTGGIAIYTDTLCVLQDRFTRTLIGAGEEREGVYYFTGVSVAQVNHAANEKISPSDLWHRRLGHPSSAVLSTLPAFANSKEVSKHISTCDICFRAKQTRDVFHDSFNKAPEPFALIHCDVWGPYRSPSSCGAVYFLTIVDDYSRAVWVYLMLEKSEVAGLLRNFCTMSTKQFNKPVRAFRTDNGSEFMVLASYFRENGILHQTSCVDTPQQNGRVERKHRHLLNVARACLFQSRLPVSFWGESILVAAHLINRTPTPVLNGKTPYEMLHGTPPSYDSLRIFGCLCYAHRRARDKDKFGDRSRKCIFIGYPYGKKAWRLYDLERSEFFASRDVVCLENEFPGISDRIQHIPQIVESPAIFDDPIPVTVSPPAQSSAAPPDSIAAIENSEVTLPGSPTRSNSTPSAATNPASPPTTPTSVSSSSPQISPTPSPGLPELLGRGQREKKQSVLLKDYVLPKASNIIHSHLASSFSNYDPHHTVSGNTFYPISDFLSDEHFSPGHRAFLAAVITNVEPSSYKEAVNDKVWKGSMQDEIKALEDNKTWILTPLPHGKRAIGSKWVYRIKYHSNGKIARHKSRLVALGNRQQEGLDYTDTFAPVAKPTTVRLMLQIASAKQWEVHQMDVHNAFLHGDLHEEVYMKLPPGFQSSDPSAVCLLKKSLYGLKQAPRCWFAKLRTALLTYGFVQSKADYSLFSYTRGSVCLHILIYVDDFIVAGNDLSTLQRFKNYLSKCFHMKDLGKLKYFLGIEVARNPEGIFISQRKYALDIVAEAGFLGCKPHSVPTELNHKLSLATGDPIPNPESYRRMVGRLIYLTFTRPELCYIVQVLSQFMQRPLHEHWHATLRVVRYLKGCPGQGVLLRADSSLHIQAFCDSDWAACPISRRSLSAYIVLLGSSPISWKTKKQKTVSMSSAEAEYRAMSFTLRELKWLKQLLASFGVIHNDPMSLYCDSKSALHIAANPVFHERTKHVELDCHLVRDAVEDKLIKTMHISTKEQPADLLTKALPSTTFHYLLSKLGIQDVSPPT